MPPEAIGEHRRDATSTKLPPVPVGVIATVADQAVRSPAGTSGKAGHRGHAFDKRQELGDVVAVRAGHGPRQRRAVGVGQEVVLGARTLSINWARARFGAPFLAWIWLESTTARDHSISPA